MFAVIMAGGSGTRFWPASRARLPKQFLKITSDRTMFEDTVARVRRFTSCDRVYAVVGRMHAELVNTLLGENPVQVLTEPRGRNTAACIGLAALHVKLRSLDDPIVVLPADHFIADAERFAGLINEAGEFARNGDIVTLGVSPSRPETGYGYIELDEENPDFMKRFVEKPDSQTAMRYIAGGRHLWNSGIFIFTAGTILGEIRACLPQLAEGLTEIESAIGSDEYESAVARVYDRIDPVSIDYGVMEKTTASVRVLRADFGWSDVGSWQALYELRAGECDEAGNLLLGRATAIDSHGNLVYSTGRRVALLGVENLVVVETEDAVMVTRLDRSQDVKIFPENLEEK
ncbi:MAG: NTP transferase domain-containing protein [Blastocatellales bacterium]|nr:NTP transferase domain-containing protein [Blastocatellales bacterium]